MKRFLLQFSGNSRLESNDMSRSVREDCKKIAIELGFLRTDLNLTPTGATMLTTYEHENVEREIYVLREVLTNNHGFRFHWAWICDKREVFATSDLVRVFRKLGYLEQSKETLKLYIRTLVDWARTAEFCVKTGVKGYTYRILDRIVIGAPDGSTISDGSTTIIREEERPEDIAHRTLFKINAYICDFLADRTHEGDLETIKLELETLRDSEVLDNLIIDLLEKHIITALETKSEIAFAMVAQSLKSLRDRYIEGRIGKAGVDRQE